MKKTILVKVLLAAAVAFTPAAHAQDYPGKAIKIIVPNPPGGGPDVIGRILADKFLEKWGQPVIVENRAGSGGNIGSEVGFRAAPDGYTLLFAPHPPLVINKSLYAKLNFDPDAFVPISVAVGIPVVMVVNAKVAAQNLQQLIALAKVNPDRLNYGSGGSGGTPHVAAEYFKSKTGVKIVHVPYKGNVEAIGTTPEEMAQFMRIEREKWGNLIREIGAKAD